MTIWQVGFLEQALRVESIHWARIMWSVTRQHIDEARRVLANYLSRFLVNFYIVMGLLTVAEQKRFPLQTHVVDGDEIHDVNKVDTDQKDTQLALLLKRADGLGDEVKEWPQKLHEVAIRRRLITLGGINV